MSSSKPQELARQGEPEQSGWVAGCETPPAARAGAARWRGHGLFAL